MNRLASQLTNRRHLENVYTILYTMPGIPSVYYGSEWAVEGARTRESDAPLRPCLELAEMTGRDQALCAHLSKLARIRAAFPALRYGDFENVVIKNEQLIYRRATSGAGAPGRAQRRRHFSQRRRPHLAARAPLLRPHPGGRSGSFCLGILIVHSFSLYFSAGPCYNGCNPKI